jgi:hypothetical protein
VGHCHRHGHVRRDGGEAMRTRADFITAIAIICLFASIFLAWALMRTNVVKTSLELMGSPPVTTGMASNAPVNSVAKP